MKNKKIPMRTCVVTREKCEKKDLIRVVRTPEGEIKIDETGKLNGRGCYLRKTSHVIEKAKQSKILEKNLEVKVPDSIYEELLETIK